MIELISIHVPKTAGVSFRTLLQSQYGENNVVFDYADQVLDPQAPYNADKKTYQECVEKPFLQKILQSPNATRDGFKVIHGHFATKKYKGLFPNAKRIVWLRHPISRLISHYYYWLNLPVGNHSVQKSIVEKGLSLRAFAQLDIMRNVLTRVFLDGVNPEDFAFIGIQEQFDKDLSILAEKLGWNLSSFYPEAKIMNKGHYSDNAYSLDALLRKELEELNSEDIAFYNQILKLRGIVSTE